MGHFRISKAPYALLPDLLQNFLRESALAEDIFLGIGV
jgi:hypothetical protein